MTSQTLILNDHRLSISVSKFSLSSTQILTVALLNEVAKGKRSWWYPYLTQFPSNYDILASFDQFEIQTLQLDDAIWAAEKALEKAKMEWKSATFVMEELMFKPHYMSFKAWIWASASGDQVDEYQPLCEVQSDKATIEITSRYKGNVSEVLHDPGDIVKVGETLLRLVVDDSAVPTTASEASLGSDASKSEDHKLELRKTHGNENLSTPAVRNLAKQHGIDLDYVTGTGKNGRIMKEDVLKYGVEKGIIDDKPTSFNPTSIEPMAGPEEKLHEMAESLYQDKIFSLRAYQRAMVKSMTAAASVPHFHYVEEIKCDGLIELKTAFQKANTDPDIKFTFLPVLIKAMSMSLTTHPLVNSTFNLDNYEVTLKGFHNIGIAMATPSGLVVPNIKNVQSLSILEITKELSRLIKLAMANKLPPADISGGTITLSNIGSIGGKYGSPLINVPEVAIIALGKIQKVATFRDDGTIDPVSLMTVCIAADHRILDGANVDLFCEEWKMYIEKPELLLLHMR